MQTHYATLTVYPKLKLWTSNETPAMHIVVIR